MSLSSILGAAGSALTASQVRIAVANTNVANADDLTYTRKTVTAAPTTATVAVSDTVVQRAADAFLSKTVLKTAAAAGHDAVIDGYLQSYDAALGSTDGGDDISSLMSAFATALSALASSADDTSKAQLVSDASALAQGIKGLSDEVQALRTQASSQIETTVGGVNQSLKALASLNDQIATVTAQGGDVTTLEDQRDAQLATLSGLIGVSSYVTSDNQLRVYATGGDPLLGTTAATLSYAASSQLGAGATYPGGIAGITLNGKDVTASLGDGELGALVTLRDTTLPGEQDKLDALAATLITQVNAVTNAGSAVPAPTTLTSAGAVSATDAFAATGSLRVAVVDSGGTVVGAQDLDLSTLSTVGDLVTALNGVGGLSASIGADGKLSVTATNGANGVALADLGAGVGSTGAGVSAYFGFNDLFSGSSAADIGVASGLAGDPGGLVTAALPATGTLAAGDRALSTGDSTVAGALSSLLTARVGFAATGGQGARTTSLSSYASSFVAGAATMIADAAGQSATSTAASDAATSRLQNLTAVNIDEELALLTQYQSQYTANAQLISMVRDLFDALVSMVN
ncbi:flagellar hook-associated protein FlgK [Caulobacter sp. AP07]|uniref:flagellar hook-associated protein FlgK n=1 Tax=Caulobacter sp. AP07 TaxID=1144304 RepID=UPI00027210FE|nr:flagellar hook-associated protein FlgK [Caulobacter sp. AP07]EJL34804.1 flagellar hook-associated protein FlgK [Caulobacter sp. AP07]